MMMMMRWNEQPNLPLWGSLPMRVVARDDRASMDDVGIDAWMMGAGVAMMGT